ncbi:hypothetical protein TREES_T100010163 [Tupaia chinensis]|uniref:Uncharacterized protein n=1 Tax=Tupaia chinensis TaxID=246437 RepID=L9JG65_TUPCH|nr:hypothetical protein TREES_T100010163 [Tupaia chinensis]
MFPVCTRPEHLQELASTVITHGITVTVSLIPGAELLIGQEGPGMRRPETHPHSACAMSLGTEWPRSVGTLSRPPILQHSCADSVWPGGERPPSLRLQLPVSSLLLEGSALHCHPAPSAGPAAFWCPVHTHGTNKRSGPGYISSSAS